MNSRPQAGKKGEFVMRFWARRKEQKRWGFICACAIVATIFIVAWTVPASAAEKATLRLEWKLTGYHAPFYWAKEKGYYAKEGIDLVIKEGSGSGKTINALGANRDTFGFADHLALAKAVAKGVPVKAIYSVQGKSAWAIISFEDNAVRKPQDLMGKSLASVGSHLSILKLWLKINNVPVDSVKMRIVGGRTRNTTFAKGSVDTIMSITTGSPNDFVALAKKGKGKPVHFLPFTDWGVKPLGQGILVHKSTLKRKKLIRGFLRATQKAWKEAAVNVNEAVDIALKHSPGNDHRRDSVKLQFVGTLELLKTPSTWGKPLGWMSEKNWKKTEEVLLKTGVLKKPLPVNSYYTNEFVPGN